MLCAPTALKREISDTVTFYRKEIKTGTLHSHMKDNEIIQDVASASTQILIGMHFQMP